MPGITVCPFCQSSTIRPHLPVQDLYEYECDACQHTWLVARPKRQAKVVDFAGGAARLKQKRSASGSGR